MSIQYLSCILPIPVAQTYSNGCCWKESMTKNLILYIRVNKLLFLDVYIFTFCIVQENKGPWKKREKCIQQGIDRDSLKRAKADSALLKEVLGNIQPQPNKI